MNQNSKKSYDYELFELIKQETLRQELVLRLIPSENYVSKSVLKATGSCLTNKYSEGYPGKRYYQGQQIIDKIERLTIERAKYLFGAEHANVQPYSGSIAVLACYFAVCKPGDTVLAPKLSHGGHLSHGHKANITGNLFNVIQYGVERDSEDFNLNEIELMAKKYIPKMIIVGGTALPRNINFKAFSEIAKNVSAVLLSDMSHTAGLIAGKVHPNPFPYADIAVSTSHKTLRGPRGAFILCKDEFSKKIDKAVFPMLQGGPHQHTQSGICTTFFEAMQPAFQKYSEAVIRNNRLLADILKKNGLRLISNGTDNHLILADVTSLGWNGPNAAIKLEKAGIIVNSNMIPFDKGTAVSPSGIRLGTPAITTRGFGFDEIKIVGTMIMRVLGNKNCSNEDIKEIRNEIINLTLNFPVPEYFV